MMRGENCMEASVSVISRIAKTMETTVMMEAAMPPKMNCATCGSEWEGKSALGTMSLNNGKVSSSHDRIAPAQPSVSAIVSGRTRKPPRRLYVAWRSSSRRRLFIPLGPSLSAPQTEMRRPF